MRTYFKILLLSTIYLLAIACFLNSCAKDDIVDVGAPQQHAQFKGENNEQPFTILGRQRNNPFTIANINAAKVNFYGINASPTPITHQYVKFLPNEQDHLAYLEDWETENRIPLFDYPLEYEVLVQGEQYIDPNIHDSIYTYQYATIPKGVLLPHVPYELVAELNLDVMNDPLLLAESFALTGNASEINNYVFDGGLAAEKVNSYEDDLIVNKPPPMPQEPCPDGEEWVLIADDSGVMPITYTWICAPLPPPPPTMLNECGCPIPSYQTPAGCVKVANGSEMDPVQVVCVEVKDEWHVTHLTYSDANGCWQINQQMNGEISVKLKFKNDNVKVKDTGFWFAIPSITDNIGDFYAHNDILVAYDIALDNNARRRRWAAAHTLNVVNDYRTRAALDGVPMPRTGLNWINRIGTGAAAAPMLQGHPFGAWPSFIAMFIPCYWFSLWSLPDIINRYGDDESATAFKAIGYHELGHASHHSVVGEDYWYYYRNHIINNGGYGTFNDFSPLGSHPELIALGEAVGYFTGANYGGTFFFAENGEWRNGFIPSGLMHDLRDDTPSDIVTDPNFSGITGNDNIKDFTTGMIFDALDPDVRSIRDFRDRLRNTHLSETPNSTADYNTFVDIYDVFH